MYFMKEMRNWDNMGFFLYLKRDNFGIIMSEGIKLIEFYYVLVSLVYGMDGDCIWYYIWVWGCVIGL